MAPSLLASAGGLLLLFSLSSAQTRGDNLAACNPSDGFGRYCPTTCGVSDFFYTYLSRTTNDLEEMLDELENIANLTQRSDTRIVDMRDVYLGGQKSKGQDPSFRKSEIMQQDIDQFERTITMQQQQIYELENLYNTNEREINRLKQLSLSLQEKCSEPCQEVVEVQPTVGTDCQDVANKGATTSGIYMIKPGRAPESFPVYCEIDSFGRGFTVIQRRRDGSVDFHKDWVQYKEGFGYLSPDDTTEFWLGNEKIHQLTGSNSLPTVLRIELVDWEGNKRYADYNSFRLMTEADGYRLTYAYFYGGDAGDAFDGFDFGDDSSDKHFTSHNGMKFSTFDVDNDKYDGNCALQDGSGWWMNRCHAAHLNGKYYQGGRYSEKDAGEFGYDNGIIWVTWHNRWYSLKETTMKIIPLSRLATGGQQTGIKQFGGLGDA